MAYYIAWLNGTSVARGTELDVRTKAVELFRSDLWQQWQVHTGKPTILRITKGARQTVVTEVEL